MIQPRGVLEQGPRFPLSCSPLVVGLSPYFSAWAIKSKSKCRAFLTNAPWDPNRCPASRITDLGYLVSTFSSSTSQEKFLLYQKGHLTALKIGHNGKNQYHLLGMYPALCLAILHNISIILHNLICIESSYWPHLTERITETQRG